METREVGRDKDTLNRIERVADLAIRAREVPDSRLADLLTIVIEDLTFQPTLVTCNCSPDVERPNVPQEVA